MEVRREGREKNKQKSKAWTIIIIIISEEKRESIRACVAFNLRVVKPLTGTEQSQCGRDKAQLGDRAVLPSKAHFRNAAFHHQHRWLTGMDLVRFFFFGFSSSFFFASLE